MSLFGKVLCAATAALCLQVLVLSTAMGQQTTGAATPPPDAIPLGAYERFTVLQKIRFGATTLVNPSVAEAAAVVYAFEAIDVLSGAGGTQEISALMTAGKMQFAQPVDAGKTTVLIVDEKLIKELAKNSKLDAAKLLKQGKFLSTHPTLAGARPSGEWIAWAPIVEAKK